MPTLSFTVTTAEDCSSMTIADNSSYIDISGSANVTSATLFITGPSDSEAEDIEIDITTEIQDGTDITVEPEDVDLSGDTLTDGVWQFHIQVSSSEPDEDTIVYGWAGCGATCGIHSKIGKLSDLDPTCRSKCRDEVYDYFMELKGAEYSFEDERYTDAQRKIDSVNDYLEDECDCGCS